MCKESSCSISRVPSDLSERAKTALPRRLETQAVNQFYIEHDLLPNTTCMLSLFLAASIIVSFSTMRGSCVEVWSSVCDQRADINDPLSMSKEAMRLHKRQDGCSEPEETCVAFHVAEDVPVVQS